MLRSAISSGTYALPRLIAASVTSARAAVMRRNGYLMMPGVFIPTPERPPSLRMREEVRITLRCCIPTCILDKGGVHTQIRRHLCAVIGAVGDECCWDLRRGRAVCWQKQRTVRRECEALRREHGAYDFLVVVGLSRRSPVRATALKETKIPLRIEDACLVKARALKGVIDVRRQHEVVPSRDQMQKIGVHIARQRRIAVDVDAPAPPRPEALARRERVEAARIDVLNAKACVKIREILQETRARSSSVSVPATMGPTVWGT